MWLRKRVVVFYIVCATTLIVTFGIFNIFSNEGGVDNINFEKFSNYNASKQVLIPNIVHYVLFNKTAINFVTYLSIISVLKVQNPKLVLIHCDNNELAGPYWRKLKHINTNTTIKLVHLPQPTHVYGQRLSSVYHATDVARIQVLRTYGGVYLDGDVLVLNNFNKLRYYEMVVGLPSGDYMGTQVLMANKNARFLTLWLEGYKQYQPRDWYYNAGIVPTKILRDMPYIAHKEEEKLGVQNLLDKLHSTELWDDWRKYYTIHLLARHSPTPKVLNEEIVQILNTNFGDILRWILNL